MSKIIAVGDRVNIDNEVERIVALPYRRELRRNEDGSWFARIVELRGCMTEGDTQVEALENLDVAMREWVRVQLEDRDLIPLPSADAEYSGKFVVRVPPALHRDLADYAEREGVSLNQLVTGLLSRAVGRFEFAAQAVDTPLTTVRLDSGKTSFGLTSKPNGLDRAILHGLHQRLAMKQHEINQAEVRAVLRVALAYQRNDVSSMETDASAVVEFDEDSVALVEILTLALLQSEARSNAPYGSNIAH